jgi:hypothetical protein
MPDALPTCMATGCTNPAIAYQEELTETPKWRRPPEKSTHNQKVFEMSAVAYFCAEHRAAAKATCHAVRDPRIFPIHSDREVAIHNN